MRRVLAVFWLLLLSVLTLKTNALPEQELHHSFANTVMPYIEEKGVRSYFLGVSDVVVRYLMVPADEPQGVIIIAPGKSEPYLKYSEVIYDLRDLGYTVFVIDHRGQGFSQKLLSDPEKTHVEQFDHYVQDFKQFIFEIVKPETYKNSVIIGHSMGATVAAGFLKDHPKAVSGAILTSGMFSINTGSYAEEMALILTEALNPFMGEEYAPGQSGYELDEPFDDNKVTSSLARFDMRKELYTSYPEFAMGGATVRWLRESLSYTRFIRTQNNVFQIPTLFFQAGRDQIVNPQGQNEICTTRSVQHCQLLRFDTSEHEILMESDEIRDLALGRIRQFILSL